MTIGTREQLRDHIHSIHDFLRNCGAGYGMTAMKIFMIFYGLKIIEPIIHKTPLDPDICTFSEIIKNAEKKYKKAKNSVSAFIDNEILNDITKKESQEAECHVAWYMFHQIPRGLGDGVWKQVIKYIDEIPTNKNKKGILKINDAFDVDLSGKVYEYFIGRDTTAISELGAYFTDRHITGYVMNKVKPTLKDGHVRTMIDMFGGSGGFTLGYTQYLNNNFGSKINWKTDIDNVYHYDMNEDVVKIAGVEMFGLTEHLPGIEQFKRVNSFTYGFSGERFDYIFTNPPYGGDKTQKNTESLKHDKLMAYINKDIANLKNQLTKDPKNKILQVTLDHRQNQAAEIKTNILEYKEDQDKKKVNKDTCSKFLIQQYIKDNDLKTCNDKEACSLVLLMALLNKDGVCAGVLKEGVFFDKKYGSIRKCLVENFNVKYVVSVPQDQFENTSTKTSIVIFENTEEKTNEIIFYDLIVAKEKDDVFDVVGDEIQMVKCKDDIISVTEKEVCRCNIKDMKDDYSLNYKNYLNNDIKVQKGFKSVKLGDICKIQYGDRVTRATLAKGKYNLYGGGDIAGTIDKYNREGFNIVISRFGVSKKCVRLINNKIFLNDSALSINSTSVNHTVYLGFYLNLSQDIVFRCTNSSAQKNLDMNLFKSIKIPYPDTSTMKKLEPTLTKLMKLHEESQKLSNDIPQKERDICALIKKLTDEGTEGGDYEERKLGDICEFKAGKFSTKNMTNTGIYPFYNASVNNPIGTHDNYCFDGDKYIIFIKSGGNSKNKISLSNGLGLSILCKGKIACVSDVLKITSHINYDYLYYYLTIIRPDTQENAKYSTGLGHVDMDKFKNTYVKILAPKTIKKQLQPLFDEVDKMKSDLEANKKEHSELSVKFMRMIDPDYKNSNSEKQTDSLSESESDDDIETDEKSDDSDSSESETPKQKKIIRHKDSSDTVVNNTKKKTHHTSKSKSTKDSSDSDDESTDSDDEQTSKKSKKVVKKLKIIKKESSDESDEEPAIKQSKKSAKKTK